MRFVLLDSVVLFIHFGSYVQAVGSDDGILSEWDWLDSLNGKDGNGIARVEIKCGDITVYFDDGTSRVTENAIPMAGHDWDDGTVTTEPHCITAGIKTFRCRDCSASYKEPTDANGIHKYGEFSHDELHHLRQCAICGEIEDGEHIFDDDGQSYNVDRILECECGYSILLGEYRAYKVEFECTDGVSVSVYATQDYTTERQVGSVA